MTYTLTADIEAILDSSADALATLAGSHVFIAGAGGFLGRYFLQIFQTFNENSSEPIRVTGVDNFVSSSKTQGETSFGEHINFLEMDICDEFDTGLIPPPIRHKQEA